MKIPLMCQILRQSQSNLQLTMAKFLKKYYTKVRTTNRFIIAEGDIPICLIAHMDTVHKELPTKIFCDSENKVLWSPQGLGADDRAGIYAIIEIVQRGLRPHIILTTDEETGGIGASALVQQYPEMPFPVNFLIELDRRGADDSVYYDCDNEEFEKYINQFGFKTAWGTFTDISIIAPTWRTAAVNLSVGYYKEHTSAEYLMYEELDKTIERVINILTDEGSSAYEYVEAIYTNPIDTTCACCNNKIAAGEGYYIPSYTDIGLFFCRPCYNMSCFSQTF